MKNFVIFLLVAIISLSAPLPLLAQHHTDTQNTTIDNLLVTEEENEHYRTIIVQSEDYTEKTVKHFDTGLITRFIDGELVESFYLADFLDASLIEWEMPHNDYLLINEFFEEIFDAQLDTLGDTTTIPFNFDISEIELPEGLEYNYDISFYDGSILLSPVDYYHTIVPFAITNLAPISTPFAQFRPSFTNRLINSGTVRSSTQGRMVSTRLYESRHSFRSSSVSNIFSPGTAISNIAMISGLSFNSVRAILESTFGLINSANSTIRSNVRLYNRVNYTLSTQRIVRIFDWSNFHRYVNVYHNSFSAGYTRTWNAQGTAPINWQRTSQATAIEQRHISDWFLTAIGIYDRHVQILGHWTSAH